MERVVISGTFVPDWAAQVAYEPLARYLDAEVWSIPHLGMGHCLEAAHILAARLKGQRVDIIGHSQGGLLAVLIANLYPERVRRVVSLGGPLLGLALPANMPVSSVRCMRWGSRLLASLEGNSSMLSVAGADDMVVPVPATKLPGMYHTWLDGVNHFSLISDARVYKMIRIFLEEQEHYDQKVA